jgi:hypothetical protein
MHLDRPPEEILVCRCSEFREAHHRQEQDRDPGSWLGREARWNHMLLQRPAIQVAVQVEFAKQNELGYSHQLEGYSTSCLI